MADAVHSTTATIIPFPGCVRGQRIDMMPPGSIFGLDGYKKSFCSVRVAEQFAEHPGRSTVDVVRDVLCSDEGDGPAAVARTLEHNAFAIDFLREALAYLVDADARIAAAADHVLAEAGL